MKQVEKLDIILKELYKYRFDGKFYDIGTLLEDLKIDVEPHTELRMLGKRLEEDGFIKTIWQRYGPSACLTSYGIEYCEENSYTYTGQSVITNNYNMTITNSPNANIVSNSSNVNIQITNYREIKNKIETLKDTVNKNNEIESAKKTEILECIDEIETTIDAGKKPKFSFASLTHIAGSLSEVGLLVVELGRLIFGVH
jgi:hypothetical protein